MRGCDGVQRNNAYRQRVDVGRFADERLLDERRVGRIVVRLHLVQPRDRGIFRVSNHSLVDRFVFGLRRVFGCQDHHAQQAVRLV